MMKGKAHIALIFCVLVPVTKGWILPLSAVGHQTFSQKNLISVSRVSRQENENEACYRALTIAECSHAQNYINALSQCGSVGRFMAITAETSCRKNSAGKYCLTVGIEFEIDDVITDCSSASCSTECRNSLISSLTELGCCLNYFMELEQNFTACGLAFPSGCPHSSLTIPTFSPTSSNNSSCLSIAYLSKLGFESLCINGRPLLDVFILNNCQEFADIFQFNCKYRGGKNCQEVIRTTSTGLENAIASCPSTSSCSSSCRSSLNDLNNDLGCCLNQFNASMEDFTDENGAYSVITANALWKECGITPPGVCESPLNAAAPAVYTAGNVAFLVLAASLFVPSISGQ